MTLPRAGALVATLPGPKYRTQLQFAEIALTAPLPKIASLSQWRRSVDGPFVCSLMAPRVAVVSQRGPMRMDNALEAAMTWLVDAAAALEARFVVVPTGSEMTTGQRDRDLLAAYFDRIRGAEDRSIVWAPQGLWEPPQATSQARRMGVLYAFDPLEAAVPGGSVVYGRLKALGGRTRLSEGMLYDVQQRIEASDAEEAYVAIESPRALKDATRLAQLSTGVDRSASP